MKRLFAFGDSFSQYAWPMWPQLMSKSFDKLFSYGKPGIGNFYIFYKAVTELSQHKLTKNDTVIIQWTEPLRYDFIDTEWAELGIGSAEIFLKNKVDFLNNEKTAMIKHLTYMLSLAMLLEKTKCKWYYIFLSDNSFSHLNQNNNNLIQMLKQYSNNFIDKKSIMSFCKENNMPMGYSLGDNEYFYDDHPTPIYTYKFIEQCISNRVNLDLQKIKSYADESEELVNKNKIIIDNKMVNNFDRLSKVFKSD
jgi:hypothetical protein